MQVLEESESEVEYPIVIEVDNVGAIYMANNHTTSQRTKPVDTRYHFVGNYVEDGIQKPDADIFTKNTIGVIPQAFQEGWIQVLMVSNRNSV